MPEIVNDYWVVGERFLKNGKLCLFIKPKNLERHHDFSWTSTRNTVLVKILDLYFNTNVFVFDLRAFDRVDIGDKKFEMKGLITSICRMLERKVTKDDEVYLLSDNKANRDWLNSVARSSTFADDGSDPLDRKIYAFSSDEKDLDSAKEGVDQFVKNRGIHFILDFLKESGKKFPGEQRTWKKEVPNPFWDPREHETFYGGTGNHKNFEKIPKSKKSHNRR